MKNTMMNNELSMEALELVAGGNIFTDAWDWVCDKVMPGRAPFAPELPPIYINPPVFPDFDL